MAGYRSMGRTLRLLEGVDVMIETDTSFEQPWTCPQCGVKQRPSEVQTVEIVEPGKGPRVEYHGKIRPRFYTSTYHHSPRTQPVTSLHVEFSCLVCGHVWDSTPDPENPTPGGAPVTFLHPVLEDEDDELVDRDAC